MADETTIEKTALGASDLLAGISTGVRGFDLARTD
jgi:hypothetical protein